MRSIVILLRDTTRSDVARCLQDACPSQAGPPWVWLVGPDPCLYIDFAESMETASGVCATQTALDNKPSVIIVADVSGRHPGDEEVRSFLRLLLRRFNGVAQDDFTDHGWTLDEIEVGQQVSGHGFFDYRGWYESKRADKNDS